MISTWTLWRKPSKYLTRSSIRPSLISPCTSSSSWSSRAGRRWLPDSGGVEEDHDTAGGEDAYKVRPYPPLMVAIVSLLCFRQRNFRHFSATFPMRQNPGINVECRNCILGLLGHNNIVVTWTGYENVFLHIKESHFSLTGVRLHVYIRTWLSQLWV